MSRPIYSTTAVAILVVLSAVGARAAIPLNLTFTMPAGVDPPTYIYYNGDGVPTAGFTGTQLFGGLQLEVGTGRGNDEYEKLCFEIHYDDAISITSVVDGTFPSVDPWTFTYTASLGTWHICFEYNPGSIRLGYPISGGAVFGTLLGDGSIDLDHPFFRETHGSVGYFRRDVVPEPGIAVLLVSALGGALLCIRRQHR